MSGAKPRDFDERGDLRILKDGKGSDCKILVQNETILVHRAMLVSRSERFKNMLNDDEVPVDTDGVPVLVVDSHDAASVKKVLEFIYGDRKIGTIEYPPANQTMIRDCVYLYYVGQDFGMAKLTDYARTHLGMHLSHKLKEICICPPAAKKDAGPLSSKFVDDLVSGIVRADKYRLARDGRHIPWGMLIDFIVAGRDVLFRDAVLRLEIDQDVVPSSFLKEVMLAQYGVKYHTAWMKRLSVRPEKETRKRRKCAGCDEGIAKNAKPVYNPWSEPEFSQKFAQVCCEKCARGMNEETGGVSWRVFECDDDDEE
ncbi:hypothetical protein diail_3422 [Diaporthe ilicicola]|nr:hypothetical protein diail_3422 [Diaporthe ilicicola]